MRFAQLRQLLTIASFALTAATIAAAEPHHLTIRPNPDAPWGGSIPDVEKVLRSTADQLWPYFPERRLPTILVEPKGGPIVLYERTAQGEIRVRLDTGDRLWAQHSFQFAHEFCHILCNYQSYESRNRWFEESLCELSSLFALRRMAVVWKKKPPYPNWKEYSKALDDYAKERLESASLPKGKSLGEWYRDNADSLTANSTQREKNLIVAAQLLPRFEREPKHWEAVSWLNPNESQGSQTLAEYLSAWETRCPEKHRKFVRGIADEFEK